MTPLQSLAASGTKIWLDSVDPDLIKSNRAQGATGATSNPIIISDLLKATSLMRTTPSPVAPVVDRARRCRTRPEAPRGRV